MDGTRYLKKVNIEPSMFSAGVGNLLGEFPEEVDGITMASVLFCKHGGLITPVTSGQEMLAREDVLINNEENDSKKGRISKKALRALMELEILNTYSLKRDYLVIKEGKLTGIKPHLAKDGYVTFGFGDCIQSKDELDFYRDRISDELSDKLSDKESDYDSMKDIVIPVDICFEKLIQDITPLYENKFTPTSFTFQGDYSEVSSYSCSVTAIADIDGHYREGGRFQELGLEGDYYLTFYPQWDNREDEIGGFWEYILVSETELIIPEARNGMYKMKKTAGYTDMKNESDYLMISPYRSICYGIWQVTEELGEPCQSVNIGYTLETSGTSNSFLFCRILDKNEKSVYEIAELIGIGNGNKYLIYCKFSADYFWDYMIIKDGMEAVLIKEKCIYKVQRISDPEKDSIYYELGYVEKSEICTSV